ncbi:aldo/keto reductase [soil metagenome]
MAATPTPPASAPEPTPAYRSLGRSGLKVSALWLGTMMFGDQTNEADARRMIDMARDAGVNAIDTADVYARGGSERMLGALLSADRERWVIATKVAYPMGPGPNERGLSRRRLTLAVDASLQRLATDWIDIYYIHRDDTSTPIEETVQAMGDLISNDKIRYWGVSNLRAWQVAQMVETCRRMGVPAPIVCQPVYNAMSRGIETELLPCCAEYGVGVVPYSPLARGVLTGKYTQGAEPEQGSRAGRADARLMQTEFRSESLELSQRFKAHAEERDMRPSQFAVAWVLRNQLINGVIGGPRTVAQWEDYLGALALQLTPEDEAFVDGLVPAGFASTHGYVDPAYPVTGRVTPRSA